MKIIQKIIKWLPLALLFFLFIIDRDNVVHISAYIFILISYTIIVILKILDAKRRWHDEFKTEKVSKKSNLNKMTDLSDELKKQDN